MIRNRSALAKFFRFIAAGGVSTLFYGFAAMFLVSKLRFGPVAGSAVAYLLAVPVSFFLQRAFAFDSKNEVAGDAVRYLVVHASNLAASTVIMYVVDSIFSLDYRIGVALTMTLVPVIIFFVLDRWVFVARKNDSTARASRSTRS